MDSSLEVAASEKERKPTGEEGEESSSELPSTSSGMLTRSGEKRRHLETEISMLKRKRPFMLDVPALLLSTLEELTEEQLKIFQSYLTSDQLPGFLPIPESQLENVDRQVTVDQMVKRYNHNEAVKNTLMILRWMDQNDLADKLLRDYRSAATWWSDSDTDSSEIDSFEMDSSDTDSSDTDSSDTESVQERKVLRRKFNGIQKVKDSLVKSKRPSGFLHRPHQYVDNLAFRTPLHVSSLRRTSPCLDLQNGLGEPNDPTDGQALPISPSPVSRSTSCSSDTGPREKGREERVLPAQRVVADTEMEALTCKETTPTVQSTEDPVSNSLTPTVQSTEDPVSNSLTPTVQSTEDPVSNSLTPTVQSTEDPGPSCSYVLSHTSRRQLSLELCNEFTPDILDHEGNGTYRFQCPRAGLFQCSITGLMFRMVLYRTVHWDRRLLSQNGKRPAGPLFKFTCLKGSVSQLYLPHCQIHSGGGRDFLSVAHVSDDNIDFIPPHEITETHIIINITGFSAYGNGLVLLFYQPFVPEQRSILNVLLLPSNVVRKEVREVIERDGVREILTTSQCKLTPTQEYTLSINSTDGHRIQPKEAEFVKFDSYENYYYPTFQLFLQTIVQEVDLLLKEKEGDELVWNRLVWLPVSAVSPAATPANRSTPPGRAFIRRHRMALETRLGLVQPIVLRLQNHKVLIDEEREEVVSKSTKTLQNQALLDMVLRKGARAQEHFYQVLKEVDPCLVEDLEEQTVR